MEENGVISQIRNKYESQKQVCPDMSGKPLGLGNCIMAFLSLLCGIGICLILMFVECLSKWANVNIAWLDMYVRKDKTLAQNDAKIHNLMKKKINLMEKIKVKYYLADVMEQIE